MERGIIAKIENGTDGRKICCSIETYEYCKVDTSGRPMVGGEKSWEEGRIAEAEIIMKLRVTRDLQCSAMKQAFYNPLHRAMGETHR